LIEWTSDNRIELLENGEQFFPRAFQAIADAKREILLETFILFEDKVGLQLHRALSDAAARGVQVAVTVDGYGSPEFSEAFIAALKQAGVVFRMFDPSARLFGLRTSIFRRLHRKILAIDERLALVGGINFSEEHLGDFGPMAKQDYAVAVEGPLARRIHHFARSIGRVKRADEHASRVSNGRGATDGARAAFVFRDNERHRNDIEQQYLDAIRGASHRVIIANAYFFPGVRILHALRNAARRGVKVQLILQGQPDMPLVRLASHQLYGYLIRHGVEIYEYCKRPLHAKVAVVDDEWATVGSSNLDPLSLWFNLEANVLMIDRRFNRELQCHLTTLQTEYCQRMALPESAGMRIWRLPAVFLTFHLVRYFPRFAGWLPAHQPHIQPIDTADPLERKTASEPSSASHSP
jgi:cardiolipin synthase